MARTKTTFVGKVPKVSVLNRRIVKNAADLPLPTGCWQLSPEILNDIEKAVNLILVPQSKTIQLIRQRSGTAATYYGKRKLGYSSMASDSFMVKLAILVVEKDNKDGTRS